MAKDCAFEKVNAEASEDRKSPNSAQCEILEHRQKLGSFTVTNKAELKRSVADQFGTCTLEGENTSHSAGTDRKPQFVPDVSLINENPGRPPQEYPFLAKYQKGDETLYYLASHHDPITASFPLIKDAIEKGRPDVVIIEGSVPADQLRPGQTTGFKSEMAYAASLATEKGIQVISGDSSHAQVFQYLRDHGYSAEDFVNQQFTLVVTALSRDKLPSKEQLAAIYEKHAKGVLNELHQFCNVPEGKQLHFADFEKWYEKMAGKPFEPADLRDGHAPTPKLDGAPLQRMFALENQARNPMMARAIADAMNHHKRVFVVYGGTHFMQQEPVMEDMLGKPQLMGTWQ